MTATSKKPKALKDRVVPIYRKGSSVHVLDQLVLPQRIVYRKLSTTKDVARATRDMVLRGAPLIGCAAAYGYAFGACGARRWTPALKRRLAGAARVLLASRPTAVNLSYAVGRMAAKARSLSNKASTDLFRELMAEADAVLREDIEGNRRMAEFGARLLKPGARVITHCNAGALATGGIGTALGVIRWAHRTRGLKHVYADETRPYLQGARLTLWELMRERIPSSLLTDNMPAHIMKTERIDAVIVGADRVAANGDAANKIGTYGLALLAKHHRIPFYVVAPSTTVDLKLADGSLIPIEERSAREVVEIRGMRIAPRGAAARHPAFDITPHRFITAIVTEKGVVRPVNGRRLRSVLS